LSYEKGNGRFIYNVKRPKKLRGSIIENNALFVELEKNKAVESKRLENLKKLYEQ